MNNLFERTAEWRADGPPSTPPLASWYTPGPSDGFGDRLLMSDNTSATSLELLRFRPQLASVRAFERALRARVERQKFYRHDAFSVIRSVEYLEGTRGLTLVSVYTPGRRLSEILDGPAADKGAHPKLAAWLIRRIVPALADLHTHGAAAHGVLTADRIVLTPDCTPILIEHALGSALEQLYLPPARLWAEFGLVGPSATPLSRFDSRSDILHLGAIVLGLLLGRRVTPAEYPAKLNELLDEATQKIARRTPALTVPLRTWLERALRVEGSLYQSALQAQDGLADFPDDDEYQVAGLLAEPAPDTTLSDDAPMSNGPAPTVNVDVPLAPVRVMSELTPRLFASLGAEVVESDTNEAARTTSRFLGIACVLLVVVAVAQSLAIVRLLDLRRLPVQTSAPALPPQNVPQPPAATPTAADRNQKAAAPATAKAQRRDLASTQVGAPGAPTRARTGGLRIQSPIALSAVEGERVLGSNTGGPIVAAPGTHEIDFVNESVGFREHRTILIKAGEVVSLKITPPQGKLNVVASAGSRVWLDGRPIGMTPLPTLTVTLGEHYVTFRHPQLGESRRAVLVRSDGETAATASFTQ